MHPLRWPFKMVKHVLKECPHGMYMARWERLSGYEAISGRFGLVQAFLGMLRHAMSKSDSSRTGDLTPMRGT